MYCESGFGRWGERKEEGKFCVCGGWGGGVGGRLPGWIQTAKCICESGSREIVVVAQCNYCQEGETLLLWSRRRGVGPVQAR